MAEDNTEARYWPRQRSRWVGKQGTFIVGFSRNLGDPVVSVEEPVFGESDEQSLARSTAPCVRRARPKVQRRYRAAKETKQRGRGGGKSECFVVPREKWGNYPRGPVEGKGHRNTGTFEGKMVETSDSTTVSTKLGRIAKVAREMPQAALTTLAQHFDIDWLREADRRTRKDGATGVDRRTADE